MEKNTVRFQMEEDLYEFCEAMARKAGDQSLQALAYRALLNEARRIEASPDAGELARRQQIAEILRKVVAGEALDADEEEKIREV